MSDLERSDTPERPGSNRPTSGGGASANALTCNTTRGVLYALWAEQGEGAVVEDDPTPKPSPGERVTFTKPDSDVALDDPLDGSVEDRHLIENVLEHIGHCSTCQREVFELQHLDQTLKRGLAQLGQAADASMEANINATIARLTESSFNARTLRRARRGLRLVLWVTLIALSFIACCSLAIALYKALTA